MWSTVRVHRALPAAFCLLSVSLIRAVPRPDAPYFTSPYTTRCVPYELWETLTPHAKHLCRRVACVKGQRLQNRFGEELPDEIVGMLRGEMHQGARL